MASAGKIGVGLALTGGPPVVDNARHVCWPQLEADDKAAVLAVLERGVLSGPFAPEVRALEREFAEFVGTRYCLTTNSGTSALHIALAGVGVGPGDEVVTSAFSFVATALAVLHQNAVPVFVDIEPETLGLDPARLEAAITPRTKAILPVHIHGTPCNIDAIRAIAARHDLPVVEDAAQAHGALSQGRPVGSLGAAAGFSLQSSKSLAAGEGGLFVTNDADVLQRANRTRMFGENVRRVDANDYSLERALDEQRDYDSVQMGWMYRTNEMSAALARSQLRRLQTFNANGRANAALLTRALRGLPGVEPPTARAGDVCAVHKYRVRLDPAALGIDVPPRQVRDAVLEALRAEGLEAVLWQTKPVPGQRLFQDKLGYGDGWPWRHAADVSYDLAQYPETTRLLDSSVVLFSQSCPIAAQPRWLAEAYAEAFAKVWSHLDEVIAVSS